MKEKHDLEFEERQQGGEKGRRRKRQEGREAGGERDRIRES